jgi:hypothetical protein
VGEVDLVTRCAHRRRAYDSVTVLYVLCRLEVCYIYYGEEIEFNMLCDALGGSWWGKGEVVDILPKAARSNTTFSIDRHFQV